jgi:hypothetical protein
MRLPGPVNRLSPAAARRAVGRLSARLSDGLAPAFVAALAALVLVAILLSIAESEPEDSRGFAEFTMFPRGCAIDPVRTRNALNCQFIAPGVYRVVFSRQLGNGSPVVSRALCCPGRISASIESGSSVLIGVPRVRDPVRATIFVP